MMRPRTWLFKPTPNIGLKGAILDSLGELDWASSDMRKRQKRMDAVTPDLSMKLGRAPTENKLAKEMGVEVERWRRMLGEMPTVGLVSTTVQAADERIARRNSPTRRRDSRTGCARGSN